VFTTLPRGMIFDTDTLPETSLLNDYTYINDFEILKQVTGIVGANFWQHQDNVFVRTTKIFCNTIITEMDIANYDGGGLIHSSNMENIKSAVQAIGLNTIYNKTIGSPEYSTGMVLQEVNKDWTSSSQITNVIDNREKEWKYAKEYCDITIVSKDTELENLQVGKLIAIDIEDYIEWDGSSFSGYLESLTYSQTPAVKPREVIQLKVKRLSTPITDFRNVKVLFNTDQLYTDIGDGVDQILMRFDFTDDTSSKTGYTFNVYFSNSGTKIHIKFENSGGGLVCEDTTGIARTSQIEFQWVITDNLEGKFLNSSLAETKCVIITSDPTYTIDLMYNIDPNYYGGQG
ncbi:hypothetical protein LCGC14_2035720, partial [marine sediment metagenome]